MKKILRNSIVIIGFFLIILFISSTDVDALTIIETTKEDEYDTIKNNSIIIGITKFEPNVVLTAGKASLATFNDANYNKENDNYEAPTIYYYLQGSWFKIDNENVATVVTDTNLIEDLSMQDIYYINNIEKILQVSYSEKKIDGYEIVLESDKKAKDDEVIYENSLIQIPATINYLKSSFREIKTDIKDEVAMIEKEAPNSTIFNIRRIEKSGIDGDFRYIVLEPGVSQITRYVGSNTEVTIPAVYDGYKVYSVGNNQADSNAESRYHIFGEENSIENKTITKVAISEGIEKLEMCAFSKCTGLTGTIEFPSTLKVIGDYSFNGCTGLIGDLNIPEGVTEIGQAAFQSCSALNGNLVFPSTLKVIKPYAFNQCKKITGNIVLPEGLTELGKTAFQYCEKLSGDLVIPESITVLEDYAFNRCSGLKGKLVLPEGLTKIGKTVFQYCGFKGELLLPSTLKEIGSYAFNQCKGFSGDLIIPDNVTDIGSWTFQHCSGLNGNVILSKSLVNIGDGFLNHCTGMKCTEVIIPKTVQRIGANDTDATHTLYNFAINYIKEYKVEEGNTKFVAVDGVLYNKDITRLVAYPASREGEVYEIPEGVTIIDELAFSRAGSPWHMKNTENTIKKLILPNSYILKTELPENYLNEGSNLALGLYKYTGVVELEVKPDNPNYKTEDGILYSKDGSVLWYIPIRKNGEIKIPDTVKTIKTGAIFTPWDRPSNQMITIPASVTNIDDYELSEMKILVQRKMITFDENCIFEIKSDGTVGKKE